MSDLAIQAESLAGRGEKGGVDAVIQSLGEAVIMEADWGTPFSGADFYRGSRFGGHCGVFLG